MDFALIVMQAFMLFVGGFTIGLGFWLAKKILKA